MEWGNQDLNVELWCGCNELNHLRELSEAAKALEVHQIALYWSKGAGGLWISTSVSMWIQATPGKAVILGKAALFSFGNFKQCKFLVAHTTALTTIHYLCCSNPLTLYKLNKSRNSSSRILVSLFFWWKLQKKSTVTVPVTIGLVPTKDIHHHLPYSTYSRSPLSLASNSLIWMTYSVIWPWPPNPHVLRTDHHVHFKFKLSRKSTYHLGANIVFPSLLVRRFLSFPLASWHKEPKGIGSIVA